MNISFDNWIKNRDKELHSDIKSEGIWDWFGGGKKAAPQRKGPPPLPPQAQEPNFDKMFAKTDGFFNQAKQSVDALAQHLDQSYGHSEMGGKVVQHLNNSLKPVSKWWDGVKRHTQNVYYQHGPEGLKQMQADDNVGKHLRQGVKDYKAPLDPKLDTPRFSDALDRRHQANIHGHRTMAAQQTLKPQVNTAASDSITLSDKDLVRPSGPAMAAGSARRAVPVARFA